MLATHDADTSGQCMRGGGPHGVGAQLPVDMGYGSAPATALVSLSDRETVDLHAP
jgi:hypothetical protein